MENVLQEHQIKYITVGWEGGCGFVAPWSQEIAEVNTTLNDVG